MNNIIPSEQDAKNLLYTVMNKKVKHISRFSSGLANYVYDVETTEGELLVIRLTRPELKYFFDGALFWYQQLENINIPLPKLFYSDLNRHLFPIMVMERLPGEDLGNVYNTLDFNHKNALADEIVKIQRAVSGLPKGAGFGYARQINDQNLHKSWIDVLDENLERSRSRIEKSRVVEADIINEVKMAIDMYNSYFETINPVCFLDDTTTKNVIILEGKLSGIVDVDGVAYGDPLLTIALTQTSLLSKGFDTEYTDQWMEKLNLNIDQQRSIDLYSAMFCVDFISELGHSFNRDYPEPVNLEKVELLKNIAKSFLHTAS